MASDPYPVPEMGEIAVPGSAANLGGGFDTLAVALRIYLRVRILEIVDDGGATLRVVSSRPVIDGENAIERAFARAVSMTGRQAPTVRVAVVSDIPMASGLGSSAAAVVAGLRVFERVTGPVPDSTLLAMARSIEGHADNAAAALLGGLTSVLEPEGGEPVGLRWHWPPDVHLIVGTPTAGLSTSHARGVLPASLDRADAVFNLQRVLAFVHALQAGEYGLLRESVRDRWHQPSRACLVPQLDALLALDDGAVLGAFLSGAGPSVALLARGEFERLEQVMRQMYERAGCPAVVRTLGVHYGTEIEAGALASANGGTA
ncbi:MAG: homoserine kinase [Acidobacteria bacterium]|nr:homoserine kinase [Acidobacteriota bacterium]